MAEDGDRHRVAVIPIEFEGELEEHWRAPLVNRLLEGLVRGDFDVVNPEEVTAMGGEVACRDESCYQQLASTTSASYLVRSRIVVQDRDYEVAINLIDGRSGQVVAGSSETCELCGVGEVAEMVGNQSAALRQRLDALVLGPGVVSFSSDPAGVTIIGDGEVVGQTPLEYELLPGTHVIKATKEGFIDKERKVETVQGVRETINFSLAPIVKDWRPKARPWGWAMVAGGAIGLGTGIALMVIHDDPYKARCSGPDNVDANGNCRYLYDTMAGGIAATVTGGVLLAGGAGLLIAARPRKAKAADQRRARIFLQPRGVVITGRF